MSSSSSMPLRELQELVNPALLDASGLTLSSVMGSPGSGFEGTESSSIPRMSVDNRMNRTEPVISQSGSNRTGFAPVPVQPANRV